MMPSAILGMILLAAPQPGGDIAPGVERLIELLATPPRRDYALRELARLGPGARSAVPALVETLRQRDVVDSVLVTLGAIGPDALPAAPAVIDLLDDRDVSLSDRGTAVETLGKMGPAVLPSILAVLDGETEDYSRDGAAAFFPAVVKDIGPSGMPFLLAALRDRHLRRVVAVEGLGALGADAAPAAPVLVEFLTDDAFVRERTVEALVKIAPKSQVIVPRLVSLVEHNDVEVRRAAVQVLGAMGPAAQPAVATLEALRSRDALLAPGVAMALRRIQANP
jgi:HEAT repeat protein